MYGLNVETGRQEKFNRLKGNYGWFWALMVQIPLAGTGLPATP
jgi:hypothetical protein